MSRIVLVANRVLDLNKAARAGGVAVVLANVVRARKALCFGWNGEVRRRHAYLIGKTGTGKSTLIETMIRSDLDRGRGFGLLDPHGDLAERIADSIPEERFNDVVYIDPSDPDFHLGFNPLYGVPLEKRALVTAQTVEVFAKIWDLALENTPQCLYVLQNCIRLLLDTHGTTLLGIQRMLADSAYRAKLLENCTDPGVRNYWQQEFAPLSQRDATNAVSSTRNKVGMLLSGPLQKIFGQVRPTVDFRYAMDKGMVVLINLAKGRLGADPVKLLGASFATAFAQAAEGRSNIPEDERRDFTLYADEFEHLATDSFVNVLSESRKLRLNLVLSHQFMSQLPPYLRQAVIGNVGSIMAFRIGGDDDAALQPDLRNVELVYDQSTLQYLNVAKPIELTKTPNFAAWVRLLEDGAPTSTRLVHMFPPEPRITGRLAAVRARARARYLRPRELVERAINHFMTPQLPAPKPKAAPKRGRITFMWPAT